MKRIFLAILAIPMICSLVSAQQEVEQWRVFETEIQSKGSYENPWQEARLEVTFTGPGGESQTVLGFWDGGDRWRVRFSPEVRGTWKYSTKSGDEGLNGKNGEFTCIDYEGENPLYRHGALRIAESRTHLEHADGEPYFWLADTVWNGVLLSEEADWDVFLQNRVEKKFTAIQFVTTQWRMAENDAEGRPAFTGLETIAVVPEFFQRMDERVDSINEHGLLAVPVILWAIRGENPGAKLPQSERIKLAEYIVARYGAHQVAWFVAGDSNYQGENAEPWKELARAVLGEKLGVKPMRIATMHPGGKQWVGNEFRNEPWMGFIGYQSGHGDDDGTFRWIVEGPPAKEWNKQPMLPVINIEPNYEAHNGYTFKKVHDDHSLRRASYWSLLNAPTAGVTYGGQGIWGWHTEVQFPKDHDYTGLGGPWYDAMELPGARQMKYLRECFESIDWHRLRPAQEVLVNQPGKDDVKKFISVAKSEEGDLLVVYSPEGGEITLKTDELKKNAKARWFHPRTGGWLNAGNVKESPQTWKAVDLNDWVLCITAD